MTRTKLVLGALLVGALATCTFGGSNAAALTMHECLQASGTTQGYTNSECNSASAEGAWHTVPLSSRQNIKPTLTPTTGGMNVTEGETEGTHAVLHGSLAGISYQITCTGLSSISIEAENAGSSGSMEIIGSGIAEFSGCNMVKPSLCVAPLGITTELLAIETFGDSLRLRPLGTSKIATVEISGVKCPAALKGSKIVEGTASGIAASPTSLEFTNESGNSLTFGGQATQFTAVVHFATPKSGIPIAVETP